MDNIKPIHGEPLGKRLYEATDPLTGALINMYLLNVVLTILKIVVITPYFTDSLFRMGVFLCVTVLSILFIVKLLKKPSSVRTFYHAGLMVYVSYLAISIFFLSKAINISTLQEFYLIIMWSFFALGMRWGILYATVTIGMAVIFLVHSNQPLTTIPLLPPAIPFWAAILVIIINFILAIYSLLAYQQAMVRNAKEKSVLNKQLHKLLDAKTDFLSTMSHELRTPLNSVIGITNLLIDENRDEAQKEDLANLRFSAENLLLLINDILDFQKMDSHKLELESVPIRLPQLIDNACGSLMAKAAEKDLYFHVHTDQRLADIEVLGDPKRLTQILFNLAGNAIKFTEAGGVKISCTLVDVGATHVTILFSVEDTGIGIADDRRMAVFEPFMQASRSISRKYGGTGLGLAIVQHLISLHGSTIHMESEPGKGSTFRFKLTYPVYATREPGKPRPISDATISKESLEGLRVLLAEDNPMSIIFMEKLLAKWDITFDIAKNGEEALEKVKAANYDVILMDLHMPVMNGIEATQHIRDLEDLTKSQTHILALTASVSDEIIANIATLGFDDYLGKPFRPNDLHHKLEMIRNKGNWR